MNQETARAWRDWAAHQPATHLVTLATHPTDVPSNIADTEHMIAIGRQDVEEWYRRVLRKLLGRQFANKPNQPTLIAVPEKAHIHLHWHCLMCLDAAHYDRLEAQADRLWRRLVPRGDADVRRLARNWRHARRAKQYVVKSIDDIHADGMIIMPHHIGN